MPEDHQKELDAAIQAILETTHPRRLVVAGPGAGKTYLFKRILNAAGEDHERRLVFTLINNLKNDLQRSLGELASVFTFHGYCRHLLHRDPAIRGSLTEDFVYFPGLKILVATDWRVLHSRGDPPDFVRLMQEAQSDASTAFFLERSDYYDAVGFDDSVYRAYRQLQIDPSHLQQYDLILVDEFQDFNPLEGNFIELLAGRSPILIAGDDDQALYIHLRGSTPELIQALHRGGAYHLHTLPYCLRCPEAVVGAVADVIAAAVRRGSLKGRIPKPYLYFPPLKAADSKAHPKIQIAHMSVQRLNANYFGRYIATEIAKIPPAEIEEARAGGFPAALVIGPKQYLRQIETYLRVQGLTPDASTPLQELLTREHGLKILKRHSTSNLGWRIILELDRPDFWEQLVRSSVQHGGVLHGGLPAAFRDGILAEAARLPEDEEEEQPPAEEPSGPSIRLTSFEGSKGLSAQYVFVVGLHDGDLPTDPGQITDFEICKFLVALTRTRKRCHILYADNCLGERKRASVFLSWIDRSRVEILRVDRIYWS